MPLSAARLSFQVEIGFKWGSNASVKTRGFPSSDFSGFGFYSYFFLLSISLLLNLKLLLSGPLYEEVPPFLLSLPERLSVLLLFSLIYGVFLDPILSEQFTMQRECMV